MVVVLVEVCCLMVVAMDASSQVLCDIGPTHDPAFGNSSIRALLLPVD